MDNLAFSTLMMAIVLSSQNFRFHKMHLLGSQEKGGISICLSDFGCGIGMNHIFFESGDVGPFLTKTVKYTYKTAKLLDIPTNMA